jgi:hypothetical protein
MGGKSIAQLGNDQGHHWGGNQYIFILHGFSMERPAAMPWIARVCSMKFCFAVENGAIMR